MKIKLNGNPFYRVTSQFGEIDSAHSTPHSGIDLGTGCNTPLYSPTDGIIERITDYGSQSIGKGIIIKTEDGDHLILGHLSDNSAVHIGQHIHKGDFLGLTGTTGRSTGCHLHVGLRDGETNKLINPERFFNDNDIVSNPPVPAPNITIAHDTAQTMSPGDLLHHAISSLSDTLMDMGLNCIYSISQLLSTHTLQTLLDTVLSLIS